MTVVGDAIVLRPKIAVPKAQAWFWQPAWQAGEREATEDIRAGRVTHLESSETLLESLD